jgi:hypothetical protein
MLAGFAVGAAGALRLGLATGGRGDWVTTLGMEAALGSVGGVSSVGAGRGARKGDAAGFVGGEGSSTATVRRASKPPAMAMAATASVAETR